MRHILTLLVTLAAQCGGVRSSIGAFSCVRCIYDPQVGEQTTIKSPTTAITKRDYFNTDSCTHGRVMQDVCSGPVCFYGRTRVTSQVLDGTTVTRNVTVRGCADTNFCLVQSPHEQFTCCTADFCNASSRNEQFSTWTLFIALVSFHLVACL